MGVEKVGCVGRRAAPPAGHGSAECLAGRMGGGQRRPRPLNVSFSQTNLVSCSDLSHFPGSRGWKKDTHIYTLTHSEIHVPPFSFTERSSTCQVQLQILLRAV